MEVPFTAEEYGEVWVWGQEEDFAFGIIWLDKQMEISGNQLDGLSEAQGKGRGWK